MEDTKTGSVFVVVCVQTYTCLCIAKKCYIVDVLKRCPMLCEVLVRNKCLHNTYSGAIFANNMLIHSQVEGHVQKCFGVKLFFNTSFSIAYVLSLFFSVQISILFDANSTIYWNTQIHRFVMCLHELNMREREIDTFVEPVLNLLRLCEYCNLKIGTKE